MPFAGLRVLSLESRRAKEMEALIRREGGDPFLAPSVQERALDDHGDAIRFVERLEAQEYGRPNLEMNAALEKLGASVTPVVLYRWELPADVGPLKAAARGLAERQFDVILFTSSIQLDHLLMIANTLELQSQVSSALR